MLRHALIATSVFVALLLPAAFAQDLPKGQIIDDVKCQADATQSYALYLPSNYSADKQWNVIFAFDARGKGRTPVERFQAAAEKYGYIVAGSNNAHNGPPQINLTASKAMMADVKARFSINPKRLYAAGQSGGARFAMDLAMSTKQFAGVIASSAGFSRGAFGNEDLSFALFGTAGTEDFNYLEMRRLDRQVISPHTVRIFVGDHTWLPSDVAVEALEWMELQAMRTNLRPRDEKLLNTFFETRKARLAALQDKGEIYLATVAMESDFQGLRDVQPYAISKARMLEQKDVQEALRNASMEIMHEGQLNAEIINYSDQLSNAAEHDDCLNSLRERLTKLSQQAKAPQDSPERQMARRVLKGVIADNSNNPDPAYRKLLEEVKP